MSRKQTTVNQPSRSDQQYVDGRLNTAYQPRQVSGVTADPTEAPIPVDQLSASMSDERAMVASLIADRGNHVAVEHNGERVIALDIDGVMANFNKSMSTYGTDQAKREKSPSQYNYVKAGWFDDFDKFNVAHEEVMDKASEIPLNDDTAPEAVRTLKDAGYKVIAVTARRPEWRSETVKFFQVHGIDIPNEDLHFSGDANKTDTVKFDDILDDAPKNVIDILQNSDANVTIYDQRYNKHLDGHRVSTMMEYAQHIIDRDSGV